MNADLARLAEEYWEYRLATFPTNALMLGDHRFDHLMEDASLEAEQDHIGNLRDFVDRVSTFDPATLTADERVTVDVLVSTATAEADHTAARLTEIAVNPAVGIQTSMPVVIPQFPIVEPDHADRLVEKYQGIGRMFHQLAGRVREGVANGRTLIDLHASRTAEAIDAYLESDVSDDAYLQARVPAAFDNDAETAWKDRLAEVVTDVIRPGYAAFRDAIVSEALPKARSADQPGLCFVDGGEEAYRAAIRRFVTLELEPEEIHRIGLDQVARLADEYREVAGPVLGTTDLGEIFDRLREDPELHFSDGPSIVAASEAAMAKARAGMGEWFGRLPQPDCLVSETPTGPIAFYHPPAMDGSRPGTFFVNTSVPENWGTFQIESMAFHEGIPGHHLQLAIAQELGDVPVFRRNAFISAYGEGWGLYTERLADEMGLYGSDLDRIGMLWGDSMRSCRLVVDTGMHALGWSRQQAIDYVVANSPMAVGQIEAEIDRYASASYAGQALSYMIGRLEIDRLRAAAEATAGDRFDIKGFHDVVLGSGVVPLTTLGRLVEEWAAA